jgi:hypothetical protein
MSTVLEVWLVVSAVVFVFSALMFGACEMDVRNARENPGSQRLVDARKGRRHAALSLLAAPLWPITAVVIVLLIARHVMKVALGRDA